MAVDGASRPPIEDGDFVQTAKAIQLLRRYSFNGRKSEINGAVRRAVRAILGRPVRTNVDRSMQILGLVWAGVGAPREMVDGLLAQQRPCGGWGQTPELPDDAYATGLALRALKAAGVSAQSAAFKRAYAYLVRTQTPSGAWHVVTRSQTFQPYFQSGFPFGHDQWISHAGTSLAALALSYGLSG
jgi:hypothetical protein